MSTYLYMHGFASAPSSTKAQFFAGKLSGENVNVLLPDLNGSSFENMTLSSQLEIIDRAMTDPASEKPSVMIGSSMGGLLATISYRRYHSVKALILLAPGFGLPRRWHEMLGQDGLSSWEATGFTEVFHYGENRNTRLNFGFISDAQSYQTDELKVTVPTLVFHGKNDETVPVSESISFARSNERIVELHVLNSDHSLIDSLDQMWLTSLDFLKRHGLLSSTAFSRSK